MAEKNYRTVAVVPEMPRTIDTQQLHVYTPVGSVNNFGVFKPDGQQFVIVNGVLRADASKLIQLANPPAIVTENGVVVQDSDVGVDIAFVEDDSTLHRKFQFTFKNIKGPQGETGPQGEDALECKLRASGPTSTLPVAGTSTGDIALSNFNRRPKYGEQATYYYTATDTGYLYQVLFTITTLVQDKFSGIVLMVSQLSGDKGVDGTNGLDALTYNAAYTEEHEGDINNTPINLSLSTFNRNPEVGETFLLVYDVTETDNVYIAVMTVNEVGDETAKCSLVAGTVNLIRGPVGPTGEQGPKGNDGVSITSVTQTGIDGGTRVTITLSDGQTTSFDVMNGINTNFLVVNVLPTENISTSTIYLVPSTTPGEENIYDEYIYVNGNWEHIGSTSVDLSDYVTKTYFNQNVGDATKNYVVAQMSKIQNLYIEMYESGSVPEKGQALTLTNSNFARVPAQGQYFALIELVNTKDKYYSICKIASVDTTTCSATVEAVTELDNGTEIEAIKASIQALITTVEGKANASDLAGKLDKVTSASSYRRVYVIRADGAQGTLPSTSGAIPSSIIERDATGRAKVVDGEDDSDIATVGQMNTAIEAGVSGCERTDNKVTAITGEGSDVQYPSTSAVVKYVKANAGTAYHIELSGDSGTITTEQYNALLADNDSYILHTVGVAVMRLARAVKVDGGANGSLQYQKFIGGTARTIRIQASGAWTKEETTYQSTSQLTTTLNSSSTNTQYPSAKATYDADQATLTAAKSYADSILGAEQAWLQKIDSGEGV